MGESPQVWSDRTLALEGSLLYYDSLLRHRLEPDALVTYLLSIFVLDVISSVYYERTMEGEEKQYRPKVCLI